MLDTMLAVAGGILIARYMPRGLRRWKAARLVKRQRRQERADIETLAPAMHRCGMPLDTTAAYRWGHISAEEWTAEARKHSAEIQGIFSAAVRIGADPEILDGYVTGTHSHEQLMAEIGRTLGDKHSEIVGRLRSDAPVH